MKNLCTKAGTPGYLAPEVLGNKQYDKSVDVFSLGVILYTCLTGQPLFKGNSVEDILKKNYDVDIENDSKIWKNVSSLAKDLILKMTKKSPQQRISIDDALKHGFFSSKNLLDPRNHSNFLLTSSSEFKSSNFSKVLSSSKFSGSKASVETSELNHKSSVVASSIDDILKSLIVSPSYIQDNSLAIPEFYIKKNEKNDSTFDLLQIGSKNFENSDFDTPRFTSKGDFWNKLNDIMDLDSFSDDETEDNTLSSKYLERSKTFSTIELKSPFNPKFYSMFTLNTKSELEDTIIYDSMDIKNIREIYRSQTKN